MFTLSFIKETLETTRDSVEKSTNELRLDGTGVCVLVVEDEDYIREIMVETLLSYEFSVFEAANGKKAIEIFESRKEEIDLVVMDLNMPVMGGR